ncbi:MAG: prephenate dehydrogenase/arogenate dehydrogenase family protein, partial [Pseudomonadota bacterium]
MSGAPAKQAAALTAAGVLYERVALVGLGLIGSSIAHAARRAGAAGAVIGHSRSPDTRAVADRLGFCDQIADSVAEAVAGADLVIVSVPVGASGAVAEAIA